MKLATNIKPISYLKSHTAQIVDELTSSRDALVITQNGEAKLVVQDVVSYENTQQTLALLKILALGQEDIKQGNYTDIDTFFSELEALDKDENQ
jgi:prevent-host-death family protein